MKLLVSVVSAQEARRALAGGADIIDVKDPREGPLGAPSPRVLTEVVRAVGGAVPVSVALGDLPDLPHAAALAAHGAALSGAGYVKVGLGEVRELERAVALMSAVVDAVGSVTAVIAAAYADARALDPPGFAPGWLPELVERAGLSGALVDTFVKDGRGLYAWISESAAGRPDRSHARGWWELRRRRPADRRPAVPGAGRRRGGPLGGLCRWRADGFARCRTGRGRGRGGARVLTRG